MSIFSEAAKITANVLQGGKLPCTIDMLYIRQIIDGQQNFTREVSRLIDEPTMWQHIERKMVQWVPHSIMMLKTTWCATIEEHVDLILKARECFPESVGPLTTLPELAAVRRQAHIRAGREAIAYLEESEEQLRQLHLHVLASALLAGVSMKVFGQHNLKLCGEALCCTMPHCGDPAYAVFVTRYRKLNTTLNPFLQLV